MNLLTNWPKFTNDKTLSVFSVTHIGKRHNHEDNFLIDTRFLTIEEQQRMLEEQCLSDNILSASKVHLLAISDGMGGHNAGEVASRICVEKLSIAYKKLKSLSSLDDCVKYLQSVINEINIDICNMSNKNDNCRGMGATLVLAIICGTECAILNIGDSRAYYINSNNIMQISKDHTEGQRMLDLGILTRKELANFPARKNLNRYIGFDVNGYVLQADEYYPNIKEGIILLCSDGVSDYLSEKEIFNIINKNTRLDVIGEQLVNEAVADIFADNATALLISFRG